MLAYHRNAALASIALTLLTTLNACMAQPANARSGLLAPGTPAPDLTATDAKGATLRLSQLKGQFAVVYFYPKDETPGCTKEACAFRDTFDKFQAAHVAILGVSRDSSESHRGFREHHHLPFALVADESGAAERAYGVPDHLGMSSRVTFLVGRDGKIARVFPDVNPALHADEVLGAVKQLSAGGGA